MLLCVFFTNKPSSEVPPLPPWCCYTAFGFTEYEYGSPAFQIALYHAAQVSSCMPHFTFHHHFWLLQDCYLWSVLTPATISFSQLASWGPSSSTQHSPVHL